MALSTAREVVVRVARVVRRRRLREGIVVDFWVGRGLEWWFVGWLVVFGLVVVVVVDGWFVGGGKEEVEKRYYG